MQTRVKYAWFSFRDGSWSLGEMPLRLFQSDKAELTEAQRLYRLHPDTDIRDAKYRLWKIMRNRYNVDPAPQVR